MKAVILAAGTGTRLGRLTKDIPKCLIPVAGVPIIDRLIERMSAVDISELIVVAGYRHQTLESHLRASAYPLARDVRFVINERYHDLGNFYSLLVARDAIGDSDFIKCDGDVLLDADILPRLASAPGDALLIVDREVELGHEEMKVRVDDSDRVIALNKRMDPAMAIGESIGLERINAPMVPALFDELEAMLENGEIQEYYERAYERLMERGITFSYLEIESSLWCEIDDATDLENAHRVVARQERARQAS